MGEGPQDQPELSPESLKSNNADSRRRRNSEKGKKKAKPEEPPPQPPPPPPATNPTISQDKTAGTEEAQAELLAFLAQKLRLLVVCLMLLSFSIQLFSPYL